jgi:hypothetical protein
VALKRAVSKERDTNLCSFSTDSSGELNILGHDGDSFCVDGTQIGILEETDEISFAGLLKGHDSRPLESEVSLEILSNLTHKTLEWQLADEELSALLVTTDFTKSDCPGPVPMRFLDTSCSRSGLASRLGGKLLSGGLSTSALTSGLLCSRHV